jgi:hypothetical protein
VSRSPPGILKDTQKAKMVRTSLKKHDATEASRSTKAQRIRQSNEIRKDRRRDTIQTKRRRPSVRTFSSTNSSSPRDIDELIFVLTKTKEKEKQTKDDDDTTLLVPLQEIRMLLSTHEHDYEVLEKITDSGVVPILVDLLKEKQTVEVYQEILWCLTNIASGQYEHTKLVLPAVPCLLEFVHPICHSHPLADDAAWVLGNIAADCEEFRQILIANGTIVPLTKQLAQSLEISNLHLAENCAWALSNLARGHETLGFPFVEAGILSIIEQALQKKQYNSSILIEIAWLLSFLTAKEEKQIFETFFDHSFLLSMLLNILKDQEKEQNELVLIPIFRIFGNLCCYGTMNPFVEKFFQTKSFLTQIIKYLSSWNKNKQKNSHLIAECAWVVSNLTAFNETIVFLLVQEINVLPLLGYLFLNGTFTIRKEVAFALTNIALTCKELLEQVLALKNVLKGFLQLLLFSTTDVTIVENSLRLIENILRSGKKGVLLIEQNEGIDALETVQFQVQETYLAKWAEALVNEFYGENYNVDDTASSPRPSLLLAPSFLLQEEEKIQAERGRGRGTHLTKPAWMK